MARWQPGYRAHMPAWSVVEPRMPTDGSRAELICLTALGVARRGGGLEEALASLVPIALGRADLVELAAESCRLHLVVHPDDPVWRRTARLLERSLATGIFS